MASNGGPTRSTPTTDTNMGIIKSGPLSQRQGQVILKTTSRNKGRTETYKPRKAVLTAKALHLFKKQSESELFGVPRGVIALSDITDVVCVSGQQGFAITADNFERFFFEASTASEASEWVDAIRASRNKLNNEEEEPTLKRRNTLSGVDFRGALGPQINAILLASSPPLVNGINESRHKHRGSEVLLRRETIWGKLIRLPMPRVQEELRFTFRDDGIASLTLEDINLALTPASTDPEDEADAFLDRRVAIVYKEDQSVVTELQFEIRKAEVNGWRPKQSNREKQQPTSPTTAIESAFPSKQKDHSSPWKWWYNWKYSQSRVFTVTVSAMMALLLPILFNMSIGLDATTQDSTCRITSSSFWFRPYHEPRAIVGRMLSVFTSVLLSFRVLVYIYDVFQSKKCVGGSLDEGEWALELRLIDVVIDETSDMPVKFLQGCFNNRAEASRRWKITKKWREEEQIGRILEDSPQPHFEWIKKYYPHEWIGRTRNGAIIYVEKTGECKPKMLAEKLSVPELVNYYLFLTEYTWTVLNPELDGPRSKCLSVFDVKGVSIGDIAGAWAFLAASTKLIGDHYPERAQNILIINVPGMFSTVWSLVLPLVNEATRAKIRLARPSEVADCFAEFAEPDQIPVEYGGTRDASVNPFEDDYKKFVHKVNENHGFVPPYDQPRRVGES